MKNFKKMSIYVLLVTALQFMFINATQIPNELFVDLMTKWNENNAFFARMVGTTSELHGSFEPITYDPDLSTETEIDVITSPSDAVATADHAIASSLIKIIDSVPTGSWIRMSSYNFSHLEIVGAINRAINRGVVVRILLSNNEGLLDAVPKAKAKQNFDTIVASMKNAALQYAIPYSLAGNISPVPSSDPINFIFVCTHGESGGCVSEGKNHNKFFIFSKVCKFGLIDSVNNSANKICAAGTAANGMNYYDRVTAQTSMNVSNDLNKLFNTISIIENVGIYESYRDYFKALSDKVMADDRAGSTTTYDYSFNYSKKTVDGLIPGSEFELNGLPRNPEINPETNLPFVTGYEDALLSKIDLIRCNRYKGPSGDDVTNVRISNAHITLARAQELIAKLSTLQNSKDCRIQFFGNSVLGKTQDPNIISDDNEIQDAYLIAKAFLDAGYEVRGSENHSKFLIVDQPTVNLTNSDEFLMFGSMSLTSASQKNNDETWVVWKNPSPTALSFYNDTFKSRWSASFSPRMPPTPVTLLTVAPSNQSAIISFSAPESFGSHPSAGYLIEAVSGTNVKTRKISSVANDFVFDGLTNGTTYKINVYALNSDGVLSNGKSLPVTLSVKPSLFPPGAPQNLKAIPGNSKITISFNAPTNDGGSPVTNYSVKIIDSSTSAVVVSFTTSNNVVLTNKDFTGLINGKNYQVKVYAQNSVGSSPAAQIEDIIPFTRPGQPTSLLVEGKDRALSISFKAPSSNGGLPIKNYTVQIFVEGQNSAIKTYTTPTNSVLTNYDMTGLNNGTSYIAKVTAANTGQLSGDPAISNAEKPFTKPSIVRNATAFPSDRQISLNFDIPLDSGGVPLSSYIIKLYVSGQSSVYRSFSIPFSAAAPNVRNFIISGLTNGTSYDLKITSINQKSLESDSVTLAQKKPVGVLTAPTQLLAEPRDRQAIITFGPPSSTGGNIVTGYRIKAIDTTNSTTKTIDVGLVYTYTFTGLTNTRNYTIQVQGITSTGSVGQVAQISGVIPGQSCTNPRNASEVILHTTQSRIFYQNSVATECMGAFRTCTNGILSSPTSYTYTRCMEDSGR